MAPVADQEYKEPTNEQLAKFLVVYAKSIPGMENFDLHAPILETMLAADPQYRAGALRHHRNFQKDIMEFAKKLAAGELQCEHIRPNGKRCPNWNQPDTLYCGLHQEDDDADA